MKNFTEFTIHTEGKVFGAKPEDPSAVNSFNGEVYQTFEREPAKESVRKVDTMN